MISHLIMFHKAEFFFIIAYSEKHFFEFLQSDCDLFTCSFNFIFDNWFEFIN